MHYWNRANFEGLSDLANALERSPELVLLAEYCRHRESGLRPQAFEALYSFLAATEVWTSDQARIACQTLLELHARTPQAHQFLTQPLLSRFVFPVLESWVADEPSSQIAHRWIGILKNNASHLGLALELDPSDVPARQHLADLILTDVEFATHHLVESVLLGDLGATKKALAEAQAVIEAAPDPKPLEYIQEEIVEYNAILGDWESYSALRKGTFPEWCASRGRTYGWVRAYYYKN